MTYQPFLKICNQNFQQTLYILQVPVAYNGFILTPNGHDTSAPHSTPNSALPVIYTEQMGSTSGTLDTSANRSSHSGQNYLNSTSGYCSPFLQTMQDTGNRSPYRTPIPSPRLDGRVTPTEELNVDLDGVVSNMDDVFKDLNASHNGEPRTLNGLPPYSVDPFPGHFPPQYRAPMGSQAHPDYRVSMGVHNGSDYMAPSGSLPPLGQNAPMGVHAPPDYRVPSMPDVPLAPPPSYDDVVKGEYQENSQTNQHTAPQSGSANQHTCRHD